MVGTDLLKKTNPICISKKLGLYMKNPNNKDLYNVVKSLVEEDYNNNLAKDNNYRKIVIAHLTDKYYKNEMPENLFRLNTNQLLTLITERLVILDIDIGPDTIIVDDDIFEMYDEEDIPNALRQNPLLNPIDEYEIEYKILFLFNLLRNKRFKRDEIDISFYTGYPTWGENRIFRELFVKTFVSRKKHKFIGYKYYEDIKDEFDKKTNDFIKFGKKLDRYIDGSEDYYKLDFIIETLLFNRNSGYSLLAYAQLIEMLIINPSQTKSIREQFKNKIKYFVNSTDPNIINDIEDFSIRLYDIRSRLVHGNYSALKKELRNFDEKYNKSANYDYTEFKEENWILMSVSGHLLSIVINILNKMFKDKKKLDDFKNDLIKAI